MISEDYSSRRNFLKKTALGGAALAAAPAWQRVLGANDRINVALIGLGARGSDHLNLVLEHRANKSDIEIVALCDVYQKRLSMASAKVPGAKTYVHHQEVLQRSDIDAVFIATPDHWHAPITLAAMERGKDVYVEKPMTHTVEESKAVAQTRQGTQARTASGRAGAFLESLAQNPRDCPIRHDRASGRRARHLQPQCPWRRLERRRLLDDRSCRRSRRHGGQPHRLEAVDRPAPARFRITRTGFSASASTGTIPAALPPTCTIMSSRPFMSGWPTTSQPASRAWADCGSITTGARSLTRS